MWSLVRETAIGYTRAGGTRLAAALAFYGVFAIAPALLIAASVAGRIVGEAAAEGQLYEVLSVLLSEQAALVAQKLLAETGGNTQPSAWAMFVGAVLLLSAVASAFRAFQYALNVLWGVSVSERSRLHQFTVTGVVPFLMALVTVVALAALVVVSAVLPSVTVGPAGAQALDPFAAAGSWLLSLAISAGLFALLFRIVPARRASWVTVLIGGAITGALFTVGTQALGLYLGVSRWTSFYGVFGVFVALLLWVYYSSQIVLIGGMFTHVLACSRGEEI